jgi:DNA-binding MltR family transcriptional regulator
VLISEELINNYLTSLFEKYLILNKDLWKDILENPLAPLNTFSNKIKMAYSLGLIDEEQYKNLEYYTPLTFFCSFSHKINF